MPRFRLLFFFVAILCVGLPALGQPQAAPPKPQTARQALMEMVTKGGDALEKHLTLEVQDLLKSQGKNALGLAMLSSMKPESGLQSFATGDLLFAYTDSAQHTKYEVHVDSDDLAGDEDSLSLSIHSFRDGKEQDDEWSFISSHFTVSMKLQQNIWRLNKISVGAEFPVGDPKFIENTFFKTASGESAVAGFSVPKLHADVHLDPSASEAAPGLPPEQVVTMLALAESMFARLHPDVGFTCSLSELADSSKMMGVDQQVITGMYNAYRFTLAGCEGKPAGSFQITAEPVIVKPGAKAFCADATQNLRASDDGSGATCLTAGKVQRNQDGDEETAVSFAPNGGETKPKK